MAFLRQILSSEKHIVLHKFYSHSTSLNFSDPGVQKYFDKLKTEHDELDNKVKRTVSESRRLFEIKPIISVLKQRVLTVNNSIESIKALGRQRGDVDELNAMVKEEGATYLTRVRYIDTQLQSVLFEPQLSEGGVLVEVTAHAGSNEAMLFAGDLFKMYKSYAKYKDWEVDTASLEKSGTGGIRQASMLLEGLGVLELMKVEGGIHRAHRIPAKDKDGRLHFNSVLVAILPQPAEVEMNIAEVDIAVEAVQASGAGSQDNNVVRILHIPTGTVVECGQSKSQMKNREIAMQKLRTLLLNKQQRKEIYDKISEKTPQTDLVCIPTKIRTYNYPEDYVKEHREGGGTILNLQSFMEGTEVLETLQDCLVRKQKLQSFMEEIDRLNGKEKYLRSSNKSLTS